jgi:hypothetical protein
MAKPSEPLLDLIFQALDHAVQSVANSNGPLIPFAIMESAAGERTLARFTAGRNPEEARQHARAHVAQAADCVKYAVAGDGNITENGQRVAVVMVEAGEQGGEHGFSFVQRFASTAACRFAQPVRNPGIIDQPPVLLPSTAG